MLKLRALLLPILSLAIPLQSSGQAPAYFQTQTLSGYEFRDIVPVDVNNDGVQDLVQTVDTGFVVHIANGDGTFRAPVTYQTPAAQPVGAFTVGDFNNDGKVDIVCTVNPPTSTGVTHLAVFLGNGDGTFQAARIETVALPSGVTFNSRFDVVSADFNHDGRLDLVAPTTSSSTEAIYLFPGDGAGNFGTPRLVSQGSGVGVALEAGDFDGDGKADIAWTEIVLAGCQTSVCPHRLHVQYGDGAFNFADTTPYTAPGYFHFNVGDLNSDGRTDIFSLDQGRNSELVTLYGQTSRTFALYTQATSGIDSTRINDAEGRGLAMADFNGDGRMDLVALGRTSSTSGDNQLVFLLATSSLGAFTEQHYGIPSTFTIVPVVGDFNRDTKPDVLSLTAINSGSAAELLEVLNTTASGNWGGCPYPALGQGIRICAPASTNGSTVRFNASANSFGQLRKLEVWVDGTKIAEQYHAWGERAYFDFSRSFAAGTHNGVFFAADIDNRLQRASFAFAVGGAATCSVPTTPGVHVCSPVNGSTVHSPVSVAARGTVTGTLARMEVWVDGLKKYTTTTNNLTTTLSLANGSHRFDFYAVNTAGQKWQTTVSAIVQ